MLWTMEICGDLTNGEWEIYRLVGGSIVFQLWSKVIQEWSFHSHVGIPIAGWFVMENPSING